MCCWEYISENSIFHHKDQKWWIFVRGCICSEIDVLPHTLFHIRVYNSREVRRIQFLHSSIEINWVRIWVIDSNLICKLYTNELHTMLVHRAMQLSFFDATSEKLRIRSRSRDWERLKISILKILGKKFYSFESYINILSSSWTSNSNVRIRYIYFF